MTDASACNKMAQWKRALISGLISASIAGICISLLLYDGGRAIRDISLILFFMALGFGLPAILVTFLSKAMIVVLVVCAWFLVGIVITRIAKRNIIAIGLWLAVYALSSLIALYLFVQSLY